MRTDRRTRLPLLVAAACVLAGCPDDGGDADSDGTTGSAADTSTGGSEGATTDESGADTTADSSGSGSDTGVVDFDPELLDCPTPGSLPFSTEASDWSDADAEMVATDNPRIKDEASDVLGVPGGVAAQTTIGNTDDPAEAPYLFEGKKARGPQDAGLTTIGLPNEFVSFWTYDGTEWSELGREQLDDEGEYSVTGLQPTGLNAQPIYAILEADQTCTPHYVFLHPEDTPVIVTDIDGTLTASDDELFMQVADGAYDPVEKGAASELVNAWADKGFAIVYLTARPHTFRSETRAWLDAHGYPVGPLISSNTLAVGDSALQYKTAWIDRVVSTFGWRVAAAYGNADTDIGAYDAGGIPKDITFVIGELAGTEDTQPIDNDDYSDHIADFVASHPDAEDF